jgi:hypothetical protein
MYQPLPLQDPTKFTKFGIFGLKIYHLATLMVTLFASFVKDDSPYVSCRDVVRNDFPRKKLDFDANNHFGLQDFDLEKNARLLLICLLKKVAKIGAKK